MKPTQHKRPKAGTKVSRVLDYLQTGHSLDLSKATALWGHMRLSDAILTLREYGWPIVTEKVESRDGEVQFANYRLKQWNHITLDTPIGSRVRNVDPLSSGYGEEGVLVRFSDSKTAAKYRRDQDGGLSSFFMRKLEALV